MAMIHNRAVKPEHQKAVDEFLLTFKTQGKKKQAVTEQIIILNAMAAAFSGG